MSDLTTKTRFEPAEAEPRIMERWLASGLFHAEPEGTAAENYSIAIPPPNVTGALHMGHALNGSIQDVLIRHHRMRDKRSEVDPRHRSRGHRDPEAGREAARRARARRARRSAARPSSSGSGTGAAEYGGTIIEQFKRLGASCDYDRERFTLDEGYHHAVLKVFVDLYADGLIYRDNYMVNWDPGSRSAISDLEVEDREVTDTLYSIAYPLADGSGEVVVATVRPETMLADTAVAVNPGDERFAHLVGRTVILPLVGRELPIIGDDYVKTDFGTGCLKITPGPRPQRLRDRPPARAGRDRRDRRGRAHDARRPATYAGLGVEAAREAVVADAARSRD